LKGCFDLGIGIWFQLWWNSRTPEVCNTLPALELRCCYSLSVFSDSFTNTGTLWFISTYRNTSFKKCTGTFLLFWNFLKLVHLWKIFRYYISIDFAGGINRYTF
jgi:hypothetical protein